MMSLWADGATLQNQGDRHSPHKIRAAGQRNREIARQLGLSERNRQSAPEHISTKLDVRNRMDTVR